jgi:hypothetical protein
MARKAKGTGPGRAGQQQWACIMTANRMVDNVKWHLRGAKLGHG